MTFYWATSILAKNFGEGLFWWQLSPKFIFWVHENFMMKLNRNSESKQPYVTWGAEIALNGLIGRKSIFETVLVGIMCSKLSRWPQDRLLQRSDAVFFDIRSNWNKASFPLFVFFITKSSDRLKFRSSFLLYLLDSISINWYIFWIRLIQFWLIYIGIYRYQVMQLKCSNFR